jgi:hypothetical protein
MRGPSGRNRQDGGIKVSDKDGPKAKPRSRPAKSKGGRAAGRSPAKSKAAKPKAVKPKAAKAKADRPKANRSGAKRLRPGELDGLVIAHMRQHEEALPLGASAIAKAIGRSSGAVGNCLERLAKADDSPVRRAQDKPRAYALKAEAPGTSS